MNWYDELLNNFKDFAKLFDFPIFHLHNTKISLSSLSISIIIILIAFRLAKYLGRLVNDSLERRNVDSGIRDSLDRFTRYLIITVGILFSLDNMGFSINSLASLGAVLMVGIGFGLQNIAQNFISGIIILIERPIKVGDIIRVGTTSGRVLDIRVRSTIVQTRDDVSIIVPNSKLISEEVVNDSYSGQQIRQHIRVGVAYGSDVEKVKRILLESAIGHDQVLDTPKPLVIFEDFGDSSLNFDLRFWCSDIWNLDPITSDIRSDIDKKFRQENIEIPFPQRDLHIRSSKVDFSKH